jgi:hypothetical protein
MRRVAPSSKFYEGEAMALAESFGGMRSATAEALAARGVNLCVTKIISRRATERHNNTVFFNDKHISPEGFFENAFQNIIDAKL